MLVRFRASSAVNAARLGLAFLGLTAAAPSSVLAAPAPGFLALPGHIPAAALASAQKVSALDARQPVSLALTLPLHHQAELADLLRGLSDPKDPRFGQFLSPEGFAARFSPTPAEYARVLAYAKSVGLTVTNTHPNRTLLDVSGSASVVERAFGLHLSVYQSQMDGRIFFAPDADPQVPASLEGLVTGVVGLSNASVWHSHLVRKSVPIDPALDPYAVPEQVGSGPYGGLAPTDIKAAYNLSSVPQNGSGQTLGLFELDGYTTSDITAYEAQFGLPNIALQNVLVDGFNGVPSSGNGPAEVTLDIELQQALAPNASQILVYEAPNSEAGVIDAYNKIATDNLAKEISTSWGEAEIYPGSTVLQAENTAFQQMAAQGQSIFAASGDSGAYDDPYNRSTLSVDDPASQPYMVGVGGTSLTTNGAGGSYNSETTWNNGSGNGAGGGGISTVWSVPSYQSGRVGSTASKGSTTQRNVPDVSLNANQYTGYSVYFGGGWTVYGGTSCAAPLWAAFTALVNQKRAAAGSSLIGFANPPIYGIATSSAYANDFHDIADGSTNLFYPAVTGYDDATGWGTFNGANLLTDLSGGTSTPPSSSTINDTDPGLTYAGSGWFYSASRGLGDFQDDVHATQSNGDAVSYTFTGTSISYITETNTDEGDVQVYLDGTLQATVSGYSATHKEQQTLWSRSGLAAGSHTLRLVKTSGQYLLLDALQVSPAQVATSTVNDTDSGLAYAGSGWFYSASRSLGDYQDDVHATQNNGDAVSYTFTGTSISYITETNTDEGNVQVYLDGTLQATVSGYSATHKEQQTLWSKSGLAAGPHTLKLVKQDGQYMLLDALQFTPAPASSGLVNDTGTGSGVVYSGSSWFYSASRGAGDLGDDVHATQTNGDFVSFSFSGTSVSYLTETNTDEGNVAVYVDGVLKQTVSCVTAPRSVQQAVYSVSGLSAGAHTLKLVKTSGTYMLVDAFRFQ